MDFVGCCILRVFFLCTSYVALWELLFHRDGSFPWDEATMGFSIWGLELDLHWTGGGVRAWEVNGGGGVFFSSEIMT